MTRIAALLLVLPALAACTSTPHADPAVHRVETRPPPAFDPADPFETGARPAPRSALPPAPAR